VNTPYDIRFRTDKENEVLCSKELTAKELQRFRKAVQRDFYFQVGMPRYGCHGLSACSVELSVIG
jgi:Endomembrane protein 70